jgi:cytochrome c oxidase subunit IV
MSERRIPRALTIVGWLFILEGISALIDIIGWAMRGRISVNIGILGLVIGPGLFRLDPRWRRWALVFTWVTMIAAPLAIVVLLLAPSPLELQLFGRVIGEVPRGVGVGLVTGILLVAVWQYRVLMRSDVRAEFGESA